VPKYCPRLSLEVGRTEWEVAQAGDTIVSDDRRQRTSSEVGFLCRLIPRISRRLLVAGLLVVLIPVVFVAVSGNKSLKPTEEILPYGKFEAWRKDILDYWYDALHVLEKERSLTGVEWLDQGLEWFATTVCKGMYDVEQAIEGLIGSAEAALTYVTREIREANSFILASIKEDIADVLGRPLTSEEDELLTSVYQSTVGAIVEGAADELEAQVSRAFEDLGAKTPLAMGRKVVAVLEANSLQYATAFKGALLGSKLGVLGSLKAVGLSAVRDLAHAGFSGPTLYAAPLLFAFYLNDVLGTGKSASFVTAGRAKMAESQRILQGELIEVSAETYSYQHICDLFQACLLLREATTLFSMSYEAVGNELSTFSWRHKGKEIDLAHLNPLGHVICAVLDEVQDAEQHLELSIPCAWYWLYYEGCEYVLLPEPVVQSFQITPSMVVVGDHLTLRVSVTNTGGHAWKTWFAVSCSKGLKYVPGSLEVEEASPTIKLKTLEYEAGSMIQAWNREMMTARHDLLDIEIFNFSRDQICVFSVQFAVKDAGQLWIWYRLTSRAAPPSEAIVNFSDQAINCVDQQGWDCVGVPIDAQLFMSLDLHLSEISATTASGDKVNIDISSPLYMDDTALNVTIHTSPESAEVSGRLINPHGGDHGLGIPANACWFSVEELLRVYGLQHSAIYTVELTAKEEGCRDAQTSYRFQFLRAWRNEAMRWTQTVGWKKGEDANCILELSRRGYVVAGSTESWETGGSDGYVVTVDLDGTWTGAKAFGGSGDDWIMDGVHDQRGRYVFVGTAETSDRGKDVWIMEFHEPNFFSTYDEKLIGGPGKELGMAVAKTFDGGFIIAATAEEEDEGDILLLKLDSQLELEWSKRCALPGDDYAQGVMETFQRGYVVVGSSGAEGDLLPMILTTDSSGHTLRRYIDTNAWYGSYTDIQRMTDGTFVVVGVGAQTPRLTSDLDIILVKLDAYGSKVGETMLHGETGYEECYYRPSVDVCPDGGYIVCGGVYWPPHTFGSRKEVGQASLLRVSGSGAMVWEKQYGGSAGDGVRCVLATSDGGFIAAGTTFSSDLGGLGEGEGDFFIVKTDSEGNAD